MIDKFPRPGARSPQYALLGFLYDQPGYGYEIHRKLSSELGQIWHVSQSQVYNIIKRLENRGFIRSIHQKQEKLPDRQMLSLTESGRLRFEEWLNASSGSSVHTIRLEFLTRLYFAKKLFPDRFRSVLDEQAVEIDIALSLLKTRLGNIPHEQQFNRLGVGLRIVQLQSVRQWLIDVLTNLE
jgi:DNA-binding PadR family transcriptional regulator